VAFLVPLTSDVEAHARLTDSTPAAGSALGVAPDELRLHFTEPVDVRFSRADLVASNGTTVPTAPIETDPADQQTVVVRLPDPAALTPGTYVLVWRVLSVADGHSTSGILPFSVGTGQLPIGIASVETPGRPPWWRVAARWLELASLLAVVGGFAFGALVARPVWQSPHGPGLLRSWWRPIWWDSALLLAIGLLVTLVDQGLIATGSPLSDPPSLGVYRRILSDSTFGTTWLLRLASLVALLVLAHLIGKRGTSSGWPWTSGLLVGAGMMLTVPFAGHAAGEPDRWFAVLTDWLHLLAGALWLGGLPYLASSIAALRRSPDAEAAVQGARLVGRFSALALTTVFMLLVTGFGNAALHVDGPRALRDQDYGAVLIVKHVVVALVLIAASVNLLVNRPRLRQLAVLGQIAAIRRQLRATALVVAVELALGVAIVATAAALTELPPADAPLAIDVAAKEVVIDRRGNAGDLSVWLLGRLDGEPDDRFTISVESPDGTPPEGIQRLIVQSALASETGNDQEVGDRFDAVPLAGSPGAYQFPAVRLGLQGMWDLTLIVRRAGLEDVSLTLPVDTREAGVQAPRVVSDRWRLPRFTAAAWGLFVLAGVIVVGGVIGARRLPGLEPLAAALILTMVALIAGGFAVSAARQTIPVTDGTHLDNPMTGDAGSVQRGSAVYTANCLACHGPAGAGVEAADPEHGHGAAADLTDKRTRAQRDGDLYWAITNGVAGSAMPAYDRALTDDERWDVVNYLRQLQREAGT
jgi:copper transport protein